LDHSLYGNNNGSATEIVKSDFLIVDEKKYEKAEEKWHLPNISD
jgi:hypothetical protein